MGDDLLTATYYKGAEIEDLWVTWRKPDRTLVDFTVAHTYVMYLADRALPDTLVLTKATGFTGAATNPNLVVAWATTGELNTLSPGTFVGEIVATRTADSKQRVMPFTLVLRRRVGPQ